MRTSAKHLPRNACVLIHRLTDSQNLSFRTIQGWQNINAHLSFPYSGLLVVGLFLSFGMASQKDPLLAGGGAAGSGLVRRINGSRRTSSTFRGGNGHMGTQHHTGSPGLPWCSSKLTYLWFLSIGLIFAYTACAFELPQQVEVLKEASQVASIHGMVFIFIAAFTMMSSHLLSARTSPFPFSPLLAALPLIFATLSNALLVPILGMESWLDNDKHDEETSVLLVVQMLSVAESAAAAITLAVILVRYCRGDRRRQALEAAAAAAASTSTGVFGIQRFGAGTSLSGLAATQGAEIDPSSDPLASALLDQQIPSYLAAADAEQTQALLGWLEYKASVSAPTPLPSKGPAASGETMVPATPDSSAFGANVSADYGSTTGAAPDAGSSLLDNSMMSKQAGNANISASSALSSFGSPSSPQYGAPAGSEYGGVGSAEGAPVPMGPRGLIERLAYLQRREIELMVRLDAALREVVAAAAGTGQTAMPSLLRSTTEELVNLQNAHVNLQVRCDSLDEQVGRLEGELARAGTAIAKLRAQLKEERKKRDKLLANLDAQREADAQAEATILMLQGQIASGRNAAASAGLPMSMPTSFSGVGASHLHAASATSASSSLPRPSFIQQLSHSLGVGGGHSSVAAAVAPREGMATCGNRSHPSSLSGMTSGASGSGSRWESSRASANAGAQQSHTSRASTHTQQGPLSASSLGPGPSIGAGGRGNSGQKLMFGEPEED